MVHERGRWRALDRLVACVIYVYIYIYIYIYIHIYIFIYIYISDYICVIYTYMYIYLYITVPFGRCRRLALLQSGASRCTSSRVSPSECRPLCILTLAARPLHGKRAVERTI